MLVLVLTHEQKYPKLSLRETYVLRQFFHNPLFSLPAYDREQRDERLQYKQNSRTTRILY